MRLLFFKSVISQVITLILIILTVGVGTSSLIFFHRERASLIASAREGAELLLAALERAILNAMRFGSATDVQALLETVGRSHDVADVRIFSPDGTILSSARPAETGGRVSGAERSLFLRNQGEGVFQYVGAEKLVLIRPILAQESCYRCHDRSEPVVGILNINLSLDATLSKLRETRAFFIHSTALIITLLATAISLVLLCFVRRPIRRMAQKMAQVEAGDLSVRLHPLRNDEMGSLANSFNSMVDNLEKAQKELEVLHLRQMERADRLASVGEMSTGIAHEIKNPLAGISGAISVLADDYPEGDPRREIVRQVLEQIARLDKTATDLLHFGRPGTPEFSYVDINGLVQKTLFFIDQHPEARGIGRVEELSPDLPPVWIDEKQIQQALFNVIINAIQAMKGKGTLTLRTESGDRSGLALVRVLVCDTGPGIAPQDQERIFAPFHTTKTQGTGLGLPISRQLLEQHGGTIRVESRPGEGATFVLEIPVLRSPFTDKEVVRAQA